MAFARGTLLRKAAITAVLAAGLGAGTATVAVAATHGSTPSVSTSATSTMSSSSAKPAAHNCPNMGSRSGSSTHSNSGS